MSESDEDRHIAEAKAYRIQKYQGVVPFPVALRAPAS